MPPEAFRPDRRVLIGLLATALAPRAVAQSPASLPASGAAALPSQLIKTGLYLIGGGGGNTLLRLSANGLILVNGKAPGQYRALRSKVRSIGRLADMPVRVLFLTDLQPQHAGNAAMFLDAGVAVIVPRRAAAALAPGAAASAPPTLVPFDGDYRLSLGGVEVRARQIGSARTGDSTVVHFPDLKVLALGDLVTPAAPLPDYAAGGSLTGWVAALAQALDLDFEIAVPSEGPPLTRGEVAAFKLKLETLVSRGRALLRDGVDRARFEAALDTSDLGWRVEVPPELWAPLRADLAGQR